ncbi:hypothetical protein ACXYMO_04830 [Arenibacterium sp. CAU 1754]
MQDAFLVTTSSEGLQPLGTAAQRSYELVTSAVERLLSPAHAAIFAEPVAAPHGDKIDWYAGQKGQATALPDLPEPDQDQLRDRLGRLIADIRSAADQLRESDSSEDQRLGEALDHAIEVPDEAMVFGLRDAAGALLPVLVHWAWLRDEQRAVRGVLTAMVPRPGGIAATQPGASERTGGASRFWWWLILLGWLLLAALLAAILYVLIAPCGINQGRLIFCQQPDQGPSAVLTEKQRISDEIVRLEHDLALTNRLCRAVVPVIPAPPDAAPAQPEKEGNAAPDETDRAAVAKRITERGARRGDLNFTLEWSTVDDIDLYVTCPTGVTVSYKNKGDCNGTYDLDANVVRAEAITDPVENIVFDQAPTGVYKVRAHLRSERTEGEKPVTLHVLRRDGPSQSYTGKVGNGKNEWITNISISR